MHQNRKGSAIVSNGALLTSLEPRDFAGHSDEKAEERCLASTGVVR